MPLAHPAADVWTLLADVADATPDAPAFIHGERRLSFAELLDCSARAAQGLSDLGVGPGDPVALWLPEIPAWPILYFACGRLGAIAVAVDTDIVPSRSPISSDARAPGAGVRAGLPAHRFPRRYLTASSRMRSTARDHRPPTAKRSSGCRAGSGRKARALRPPAAAPARRRKHASARAPCKIFTTSGTTKSPKFVLHRQGAIVGHAQPVARTFGYTAPEP